MGWPLPLLEQGFPSQSIPKIGATSPKQEQHSHCWGQRPAALMCSAGNQQSFTSPFCFSCQIHLELKLSSCILAGQMEWANVGKGLSAAKLQCWGGWESRALLSRRLQYWRTGSAPAGSRAQADHMFPEVSTKGKTAFGAECSEPCSATSSPEGT